MMKTVREFESEDAKSLLQKAKKRSDGNGDKCEIGQIFIKKEPIDADDPMNSQDQVELKQVSKTEVPDHYFKAKTAEQILAKFEAKSSISEEQISEAVVNELAFCHSDFIKNLSKYTTSPCLSAISQLCHRSTMLAHKIWVDLFPRIWDLLEDKHQTVLAGEMGPFLCSGSHLHQGDCYRSSINTFVEGMANCSPAIPIRPAVLKYLGKTHNLWHRSALLLEEASVACEDMLSVNPQILMQQPWLDFGMHYHFSY